jgi:phage terminase small subunit
MKPKLKTFDEKRNRSHNPITEIPVRILTKVPKPPKRFTAEMKETWKQTGGDLIIMGCFTTQSLIPLESYCYAIANMRAANRDKKTTVSTRTAANKECRVAAETLGLTPASHSKLRKLTAAAATSTEDDRRWSKIIGETGEQGRKRRGPMRPRPDS